MSWAVGCVRRKHWSSGMGPGRSCSRRIATVHPISTQGQIVHPFPVHPENAHRRRCGCSVHPEITPDDSPKLTPQTSKYRSHACLFHEDWRPFCLEITPRTVLVVYCHLEIRQDLLWPRRACFCETKWARPRAALVFPTRNWSWDERPLTQNLRCLVSLTFLGTVTLSSMYASSVSSESFWKYHEITLSHTGLVSSPFLGLFWFS